MTCSPKGGAHAFRAVLQRVGSLVGDVTALASAFPRGSSPLSARASLFRAPDDGQPPEHHTRKVGGSRTAAARCSAAIKACGGCGPCSAAIASAQPASLPSGIRAHLLYNDKLAKPLSDKALMFFHFYLLIKKQRIPPSSVCAARPPLNGIVILVL